MTKGLLKLMAAAAMVIAATGLAGAEGLTKIADNVYSYVGVADASPANSFAANAGIVIGKDGVLVVDTLISAKEARRFLADIRKMTDKPIRYVVDTHTHLDHAFGNCVFAGLGATVIAHTADCASFSKNSEAMLKKAAGYGLTPEQMEGTSISVPYVCYSDRLEIDLGGEKVELIRVAPSHTEGSTLVYLAKEKILFAGDVLFTDFHPYLADGDIAGWVKNLDAIVALPVEKIVPGHGPLSTKKDVREMKEYILLFDAKARELAERTKDLDEASAELRRMLPKRSQAEWMVSYNLKVRYIKPE